MRRLILSDKSKRKSRIKLIIWKEHTASILTCCLQRVVLYTMAREVLTLVRAEILQSCLVLQWLEWILLTILIIIHLINLRLCESFTERLKINRCSLKLLEAQRFLFNRMKVRKRKQMKKSKMKTPLSQIMLEFFDFLRSVIKFWSVKLYSRIPIS